jgi:hypothetical protein
MARPSPTRKSERVRVLLPSLDTRERPHYPTNRTQWPATGAVAMRHEPTCVPIKEWSLTTLKKKLIKIGAKVVSHARYVTFQMAEVAIAQNLFADILHMIAELRPPPIPSTA